MTRVLVLTCGFEPHKVVNWEHAIKMIYNDPPKVEVIETTAELLHPSGVKMPSVVRLLEQIVGQKRAVKFSRMNVLSRDNFKCAYCGHKKKARELNYDHVVPRHLGGRTNWDNIVSSCYPCNSKKRNRTPEQAGMKLLVKPHRPSSLPLIPPRFDPKDIPEAWAQWVREYFIEDEAAVA